MQFAQRRASPPCNSQQIVDPLAACTARGSCFAARVGGAERKGRRVAVFTCVGLALRPALALALRSCCLPLLRQGIRAFSQKMTKPSPLSLLSSFGICIKCTNIERFSALTNCCGTLCRIDEKSGNVLAKWRIRRFWESLGCGIEIVLSVVYNIHITQIEV